MEHFPKVLASVEKAITIVIIVIIMRSTLLNIAVIFLVDAFRDGVNFLRSTKFCGLRFRYICSFPWSTHSDISAVSPGLLIQIYLQFPLIYSFRYICSFPWSTHSDLSAASPWSTHSYICSFPWSTHSDMSAVFPGLRI